MKNNNIYYLLFIVQLLLFYNHSTAQTKQGVFFTEQDFVQNKITPEQGVQKLHSKSKFIILKVNDSKSKFNKDSIFGFIEKSASYRCNHFDQHDYQILENGEIVVYMRLEPAYGNKKIVLEPQYYYSQNLYSKILPLTIINIKRTFPNNEKLHDNLDIEFYDKEITFYNKALNTYQINFLIKQYK
jgi:hypothetical protein